uniref:amidohydrolase family protein n=1 Tax=Citricoccus sp. TaxID=1978372 RepID=UPI0028BD4194
TMHERGVRGVRFNFVKRLVQHQPFEELGLVADKIRDFGWHLVLYFEPEDLPELEGTFAGLGVPLVIDHMGRPDVRKGADSNEFSSFLRFVERTDAWVKVSCPERLTENGPYAVDGQRRVYTDVVPFARRVMAEFPERTLWGTDWPHPNLRSHMPDDALLLGYIPQIAPTAAEQQALLVTNPMSLYWP